MPEQHSFEYAVIRVVPKVEREEFMNVGVIIYCQSLAYLDASFTLNEERLRALSAGPGYDRNKKTSFCILRNQQRWSSRRSDWKTGYGFPVSLVNSHAQYRAAMLQSTSGPELRSRRDAQKPAYPPGRE